MWSASSPAPTGCSARPWCTPRVCPSPHNPHPKTLSQPAARHRPRHTPGGLHHHPETVQMYSRLLFMFRRYLACILSLLPTSTNESWMQNKVKPKSCLLQISFTIKMGQNRNIYFLENILVRALFTKCIFAPSTYETPLASKILRNK